MNQWSDRFKTVHTKSLYDFEQEYLNIQKSYIFKEIAHNDF